MTANDNNLEAGRLGFPFKSIGKASTEAVKKVAAMVRRNPGRDLEIGEKNRSAAVSKKN